MISKEELEKWAFQLNMDGDCDATDKDIETLITQALATMEELETAKRCLPVDKEFEVRGSWIGSVQNYIVHLEESLEGMDSEPVAEITEDLGRLFVKIHYPTTLKAGDKLYRHAQPEQPVAATGNGLNVALSLTQMQIDWICNTCASIYNTRNDDVAQGYIDEIRATLERHTAMLNGGKL